jgi:hypothetical protein
MLKDYTAKILVKVLEMQVTLSDLLRKVDTEDLDKRMSYKKSPAPHKNANTSRSILALS